MNRRLLSRQQLKLTFRLSGLVANPFESPCGDEAHNQEVVSAKTGRVLPSVSVFIRALKGDVEQGAFVGLLTPDARADGAVTDFVNGLVIGFIGYTGGGLIFHEFVLVYWFNGDGGKRLRLLRAAA